MKTYIFYCCEYDSKRYPKHYEFLGEDTITNKTRLDTLEKQWNDNHKKYHVIKESFVNAMAASEWLSEKNFNLRHARQEREEYEKDY